DWLSSDASAPDRDDVVLATVCTTQDAVGELRALASAARAEPVPVIRDLRKVNERRSVVLYHGELDLPSFQAGKLPYAQLGDGGELVRDASGAFVVDHHETSRFSLSLPKPLDGRVMPEAGWPVVLFSHGTGGSFADALDEDVADALGRVGIAVVGYDQTLHGPRDPTSSNPELTFFNLFNPIAARDNIRQGAADLVVMTNVLASGLVVPASVTGQGDVRLDPARIGFLGHSQGSLVGAPFLSAESRVKAVTFSGLGAILTITLLERKDIVDFEGLLASLLFLPESEPLEELHPVLNLIQTFIEVSDPIAYARSYVEDPAPGATFDILHVEGMKDFASPPRGQEAFATAAHIPLVAPEARRPAAAVLVGLETIDAPVSANVAAPSGARTMGLIQYPDDTHFPIYDNEDANRRYVELLRSSLWDGRGRIIPAE
ncbi:hypothetical protein L6R52_41805, partial [Myxococcota bacterium]|nr:hypothetical protein [Myxococcota bacterium]